MGGTESSPFIQSFYSAAGFQLGLSSRTVQNHIVFEYLETNRYDVSIAIFFDPKI